MIRAREKRLARSKALAFGSLLAALVAVLGIQAPASAQGTGTTFTVNSTGDAADASTADDKCDTDLTVANDQCTLRAAIEQANATEGADTINFGIAASGVQTITPGSEVTFAPLPEITEAVTIDGYSQPGARPNTLEQGNDAVLRIELKGTDTFDEALKIGADASNVVVRGLVINDFKTDCGIDIAANAGANHRIEGNFIGTDPTGTTNEDASGSNLGNLLGMCIGSTFDVPLGEGTNNVVGGTLPDKRNVISGNDSTGLDISRTSGDRVEGNYIGTKKDGRTALGNGSSGVFIRDASDNNTIGGTDVGAANTIAFNEGDGVSVDRSFDGSFGTGNRILGNSVFSNTQVGIDLVGGIQDADGVTANDPGDPDTGPNNLQNFPDLSSATVSGGQLTVTGNLNSNPSTQIVRRKKKKKKKRRTVFVPQTFTVQFFSSSQQDPSGHGEGEKFIGQTTVVTSLTGDAPINFTFAPVQLVSAGEQITATATRNATGDTSEFSDAVNAG